MAHDPRPGMPASGGGQGHAMRLVAARLAARGVGTRVPDHADSRRLTIINARHARSEIIVDDWGDVTWEYWPWSGPGTSPADITALVLRLLGEASGSTEHAGPQAHLTLKGITGRELEARGLHVTLEVIEDLLAFDVTSGIAVTNPARPGHGRVCVTDEGSVTWEYRCAGPASQEAGTIADAIAPILTGGIGGCRSRERHADTGAGEAGARRRGDFGGANF